TPPVRRTVYNYGGERREIAIKPAHGVDALYAPRRTLLDPVLAEAATEAGAEISYRTRVSGLVWERGRVAGVRAVARGEARELRAPLVIGADGIRSIVAHHNGAPIHHRGRWCTAVTYGYWAGLAADAFE